MRLVLATAAFVFLAPSLPAETNSIPPASITLPFVHDFAWDATRSRIWVSSGTTILLVNPETANVDDTLVSSVVAGRIAISSDGQYLYASVGSRASIQRYRLDTHALDLEIYLGIDNQGRNQSAAAIAVFPGQPKSILIARGYWSHIDDEIFPSVGQDVMVFDDAVPRGPAVPLTVASLYVRPADGSIHGVGAGRVYRFSVGPAGVTVANSSGFTYNQNSLPSWNGSMVVDRGGLMFDLDAEALLGRLSSPNGICAVAPDAGGTSVFVTQTDPNRPLAPVSLYRFSRDTFHAIESATVDPGIDFGGACDPASKVGAWGANGLIVAAYQHSGGGSRVAFLTAAGLNPLPPPPLPQPQVDATGVIRLNIAVNALAYDSTRNLLWATVPGVDPAVGNSIVSIDPLSGRIVDQIAPGSEPGALVLSTDGSRLFTLLGGTLQVAVVDLNSKQVAQKFSASDNGTMVPAGIVAVQDQNDSVVIVRSYTGAYYASDTRVYDHGVARPESLSNFKPNADFGDLTYLLTRIYPGDAPDSFYATDLTSFFGDGTHHISHLKVDSRGIHFDRELNPLQLGGSSLIYDGGQLYTGYGEVWSPDTQHIEGTFSIDQSYAERAIAIPFLDQNLVVYAHVAGLNPTAAVTAFDLVTHRPLSRLSLATPSPYPMSFGAAVRAGTSTVAITSGTLYQPTGQLILVPLSSLPPWPDAAPAYQTVAPGVRRLDTLANGIASIPGTSKLAIAIPSLAGSSGNNIAIFNAATGQIESSAYAGSEPDRLVVAPDGSAVYARLSGERRIARINVASGSRDLVFAPDPFGGNGQYNAYDMAAIADGGLVVSYYGGGLAVFDGGKVRPVIDNNDQGAYAYTPATFSLATNPEGTRAYGFNNFLSTFEFKRCAVTSQGISFLSSVGGLIGGYGAELHSAGGLIYLAGGDVIDPERSRLVGHFALPQLAFTSQVVPDPAHGNVFFLVDNRILMYDSNSYAQTGSLTMSFLSGDGARTLLRYGDDGLAVYTSQHHLYLLDVSSIPLLPAAVPSTQPVLPATPGVTVVDLATQDIAYDPARDLIYAATPNREAALGDLIASIDPASGAIGNAWRAGPNPHTLSMADDQSRIYVTVGAFNNAFASGFSSTSETIRAIDLRAGAIGDGFPTRATAPADSSYGFVDLLAMPGQPASVAAIDNLYQYQDITTTPGIYAFVNAGPDSVRVYDGPLSRKNYLAAHSFNCTFLAPGATASRLYCSNGSAVTKLAVDAGGVTVAGSFPLLPGHGTFGRMTFSGTRLYTTTGLVLDPENNRTITRVEAQGPVAVDGGTVYWLDPSAYTTTNPIVTLRSFDITTLQPTGTREIKVTANDLTRLIVCGNGRLAFRAGHEIYIVNPK